MSVTRREAMKAFGAAAAAPAVLRSRFRIFPDSPTEYSARAVHLMESTVVVDLLNQFRFPDFSEKPPKIDRWLHQPGTFTAGDDAPYKSSGISAFCLGDGADDFEGGLRLFAEWNGFIAAYPDRLTRIGAASDFARAKRQGLTGIVLTLQDSSHFRRPDDVNTFWGLGQRLSQLTYNYNNGIGSGFLEERDGGLSVFGLSIVKRMNELGMAVDVSHCADQTTLDALAASTQPVVFSHANCRALVPGNLRCKTDEAIRQMAKSGGVMGISFLRFLDRDREPVTIDNVLDHFDHVAKLVGVEHVAVGSDLDVVGNPNPVGAPEPPPPPNFDRYHVHRDPEGRITVAGLDHPRRMFNLADGLIRRGYSDADIALILGGNAIRVLGGIWRL
jgi:membrane dipeptidase